MVSRRRHSPPLPSTPLPRSPRDPLRVDKDGDGTSTRSCLTLNFLKSPKSQRSNQSVGIVREEEEQVHLLKYSEPAGLRIRSSWNDVNLDQTADLTDDETATTATPRSIPGRSGSLLALPSPSSRSRRRRQRYEGELEPEGTRGQEAYIPPVSQSQTQARNVPNLRSFSSQGSKSASSTRTRSSRAQPVVAPRSSRSPPSSARSTSSSVLTDERSAFLISGPLSEHAIPEEDGAEDSSPEALSRKFNPRYTENPQQQLPNDSTLSSEDLRIMMPDLMPSPSGSPSRTSARDDASALYTTNQSVDTMSIEGVDAMNASAVQHVENGEYDEALVAFGQVLSQYRRSHGDVHPLVASTYHNLGMVHSKRATLLMDGTLHQNHCRQQSLECFQAAARTARDSLGKNHPNVAVSLVRIGFLLLQARQYHNAIITFREALRIRLEHYGKDEPHGLVANLYNNLGVCHMHLGLYPEGIEFLETALDIQRKVLRNKRQNPSVTREELRTCLLEVSDTLCNIGGLFLEWMKQQGPDARHATEAEKAFAEALEIRSTVLGPSHPMVQQVSTLHEIAKTVPLPPQMSPPRPKPRPESARSREGPPLPPVMRKSQALAMVHQRTQSPPKVTPPPSPAISKNHGEVTPPTVVEVEVQVDGPPIISPTDSPPPQGHQRKARGERETKVWLSPHRVPRTSPVRRKASDSSPEASPPALTLSSGSESSQSSSPIARTLRGRAMDSIMKQKREGKIEGAWRKQYPYDAEESCMISDSGGISERATAHFLSLLKDEESFGDDAESNVSSHEIMVVRPFDGSRSADVRDATQGQAAPGNASLSSWSGALQKNGARGMVEKRDLEQARGSRYDSPAVTMSGDNSLYANTPDSGVPPGALDENDDGLAPLGGNWPSTNGKRDEIVLRREMLESPDKNLLVLYDAASTYLKRNQFPEALHLFQTIVDCQRRTRGELHKDVGAALHNAGIVLLRMDRIENAVDNFEKAVRVRKGALGKDHPEVAASLVKVGICYLLLHNFEMALHSFRDALSVRRRSLGTLHPSTARVYNNIGCVHVEFNELRDARRAFEAALDIQRNALCNEPESGPLIFGAATTLCNLGYLYKYRKMPGKAVLVLKEALSLQESILGPAHPTVLSTMDSLAESCANSGSCSPALRYYNEILERSRANGERSLRRKKAEAILLYKMSRVHGKQNDKESEVEKLHLAYRALRAIKQASVTGDRGKTDRLERRILTDIKKAKQEMESLSFDWV